MKTRFRTLQYTILCVVYFAAYSGVHAYASVFLLNRGFTNTLIGVILAVANILSVITQPMAAGWIDKYERFTNRKVSIVCAIGCGLACLSLYFLQNVAVIFAVYIILYTLQMLYQPLIQALSFEYNAVGDHINFGLARGLGSCGFALTSAITGKLLVSHGVSVLQVINVLAFIIGILMLFIFVSPVSNDKELSQDKGDNLDNGNAVKTVNNEAHNSLSSFVKHYPAFALFVLGGTFLFFEHNALNDYLIQIITPIGGDETVMGTMVMVAALLELPAMAGFAAIEKKLGAKKILMFSAVMFTVKTLVMFMANNLVIAYVSQICQIFAYALFIPGAAYLSEMVMEQADKTKGQAYVNCTITLGGVFSALACGRLLDVMGVHSMLLVSTVVGIIGTIISVIALIRIKTNE